MSLLGWGSLALGAVSTYQGYEASGNQADAMSAANSTAQQQQDFVEAQYERIQDVYGPVEQNLSEYYQSLTPEMYEARGLNAYDNEFKAAQESWDATMAQRGLTGSGIEAQGIASMESQKTYDRASISENAESEWAAEQMGWLGMGLGQSNIAQQNIANAANASASMYTNQANTYGQQATAAGSAVGSLISSTMAANAYKPGSVNLDIPNLNNYFGGN